jgi:hypothetical protein
MANGDENENEKLARKLHKEDMLKEAGLVVERRVRHKIKMAPCSGFKFCVL